jgi:hypothetical protein
MNTQGPRIVRVLLPFNLSEQPQITALRVLSSSSRSAAPRRSGSPGVPRTRRSARPDRPWQSGGGLATYRAKGPPGDMSEQGPSRQRRSISASIPTSTARSVVSSSQSISIPRIRSTSVVYQRRRDTPSRPETAAGPREATAKGPSLGVHPRASAPPRRADRLSQGSLEPRSTRSPGRREPRYLYGQNSLFRLVPLSYRLSISRFAPDTLW